jgi:hypothetical protein
LVPVLRTSVGVRGIHSPDLTIGAISCRRFATHFEVWLFARFRGSFLKPPAELLGELAPVRNLAFGNRENDGSVLAIKPRHEALRNERADLFGREIDDGDDLASEQIVAGVEVGDLCARFSSSDFRTEIDRQFPRRLARLGKILDGEDRPDAQLDAREIIP